MLISYHFADMDKWGGYNAHQPKVYDLHFFKPFPKLLTEGACQLIAEFSENRWKANY